MRSGEMVAKLQDVINLAGASISATLRDWPRLGECIAYVLEGAAARESKD
jgi:hypothetical protein